MSNIQTANNDDKNKLIFFSSPFRFSFVCFAKYTVVGALRWFVREAAKTRKPNENDNNDNNNNWIEFMW